MLKPLVQFLFELDDRLGLSGFFLSEAGSHVLYFLRQEVMVAQRFQGHEAKDAGLLDGIETFDRFDLVDSFEKTAKD